eukprot:TRINITY_DN362_c0_g1_i1.p1 TRINITY_DN362_c0_g1~~TRINITY_DN362_c0_g1_i1.p1  ORF type:complete len:321 (-),score=42.50 TRINITY_DN362_c0_g1_i1:96-1058(-)
MMRPPTDKTPCTPANSAVSGENVRVPATELRWPAQSESNTLASTAGSFDSTAAHVGSPRPAAGMADTPLSAPSSSTLQSLIVMRHAERLDEVDATWATTTDRPWDPPLSERGRMQAWELGRNLKDEGMDITRVITSPFLRCVQTASQVVAGLSSSESGSSHGCASPVQVSVDFGLGEVMNGHNIRGVFRGREAEAKVGIQWVLPLSELESHMSNCTIDHSTSPTSSKVAEWPEDENDAYKRLAQTLDAIADQFSSENIVIVTHGFGVGVSVQRLIPATVYSVEHCGYTHAQRPVHAGHPLEESDWELISKNASTHVHWLQ